MLEHLKTFMGASDQQLHHYMIRLLHGDRAEFITTNGYAMLVNTLPVKHRFNKHVIAVSPSEFQKVLMFEGDSLEFNDHMQVGANGLFVPLETLDPSVIPDLNTIMGIQPIQAPVSLDFSVNNIKLILKYFADTGITEFTQQFTGNNYPVILSDNTNTWKIYLMPLGTP